MEVLSNVPDWTVLVAAVLTALGVIWRRFVQPTTHLLHRIEASLSYVEAEMSFNSGKTARDAIERIDKAVRHLDDRLKQIESNTHRDTGEAP